MRERARYEWREFGKAAIAWTVSSALLLAAIALVGDAGRTEELQAWIARLTLVLAIWSIWPISHTFEAVSPAARQSSAASRSAARSQSASVGTSASRR